MGAAGGTIIDCGTDIVKAGDASFASGSVWGFVKGSGQWLVGTAVQYAGAIANAAATIASNLVSAAL